MKSTDLPRRRALHRAVAAWYSRHRRTLRWRTTTNPYEILVSEIMLQQTQVSRVQEKLPLFLRRFPTLRALAGASTAEVIRAWAGMGYNNRAVRLSRLAKIVSERHRGRLPSDIGALHLLPGVGPYTAHAVACFAFRQTVPVVDVNIRRLFSRLFWNMEDPAQLRPEEDIWEIARRILPRRPYLWNQALMDIGATLCTARKPLCSSCPLRRYCLSRSLGTPVSGRPESAASPPKEPSRYGVPRRIWRGRVIQALRDAPGSRAVSVRSLGKAVRLRDHDAPWLERVVEQLRRDGLVHTSRRSSQTFVSLAA
jgi:A/G-specific adenine glycosylase